MTNGSKQARTKAKTTENAWGGADYRGKAGLARTTKDDGTVTVYLFTGNEILQWQASFSSATPPAIVEAVVREAQRLADGHPL